MADVISVVFGRGPNADVCFPNDEYMSPRHAQAFSDRSGQVWIRDLGSTNGTRVTRNGVTIKCEMGTPYPIRPGDTIRIGRTAIPWTDRRTVTARDILTDPHDEED